METFLILVKIYKFLLIILQKWCIMTNASLNPIQWNMPTSNYYLVSVWARARKHISIMFHHVIWNIPWHILMTCQNTPWQKYIPPHQQNFMSSLPCGFATWTFDNNVFVQSNINIEIYHGWCPMSWSKKMFLAHLLRILPFGFRHVPRGGILFDNRNIFYTTNKIFKYFATSFMVIVIVAFVWETS
jgi:hypothetical protein